MNTQAFDLPGNEKEDNTNSNPSATEKEAQISLPKTDRPEGPFEHSGETSGWTKEEEAEKKDQDQA